VVMTVQKNDYIVHRQNFQESTATRELQDMVKQCVYGLLLGLDG